MDTPSSQLSFVSRSSSSASLGSQRRRFPKSSYPPSIPSEGIDDSLNHFPMTAGRLPYYGEDGTFMGTISTRMNSRPLFSSSRRIQQRYAKAILDSLPAESRDPQWLSGCSGLWKTGGKLFPEEDLAVQLRQYNEIFTYLARLYENALTRAPKRAAQLVRRGAEILAAVRLLGVHPAQHRSPAGGTEARNTSRVSVWGWKPHREIALAERISERRRLNAAEARERAREEKTLSKRGPPPDWEKTMGVGGVDDTDITAPVSSNPMEETRAKMYRTWAEKELERSRKRRAEGMAQLSKENLKESNLNLNLNLPVLYGDEPVNPATLNTVLLFPRRPETIHWNYPNWNDGYDIPNLNLPPALEDKTFTTATIASSDKFLRTQTIKDSVEGISIPYSYRRPPSEPVSPKSKPIDAGLTYTSEEISTGYPTTDSDRQPAKSSVPITPPTTVSHSTSGTQSRAGGSQRFRKFRSTLKNVFPRIPWSSSSRVSDGTTIASNSAAESASMTGVSTRKKQRLRPTTWLKNDASPSGPSKQPSETVPASNRTTTEEPSEVEEKLTRTEREYQDVLEALQQVKREMMLERSERRRRSRSRPRKEDHSRQSRERGRGDPNRQSRETVGWWLCDVE